MKVLMIGAGAVGQAYGRHLKLGGAEVSFLVREKYAEECRRGFTLYHLNRDRAKRMPLKFRADGILTTLDEVARETWDQVYLCVSSTALRKAELDRLLPACGNATVVVLQPGSEDRDYVTQWVPLERVVSGVISLVSYHTPLPGEQVAEPGMAYWFPPLSPSPFSGPADRVASVLKVLGAGGFPCKKSADVAREVAFPSAFLMTFLLGLETAGWRFKALAADTELLRRTTSATREAFGVVARELGIRSPLPAKLLGPLVIRLLLKIAPYVVPFDFETYLHVHFTKVGDQTLFLNSLFIKQGKKFAMPVAVLEALHTAVGHARG